MKKLFTLLLSLPFVLQAQTTHTVSVFGGGTGNPAPTYAPQNLTIDVGDIVEWQNSQGSHNVWGELDIFPNNPEGFSSGQPAFAPWTFSHTFTIPGQYDYHCTQGSHSQTQFGTIIVVATPGVEENEANSSLNVFPNPVSDRLFVEMEGNLPDQWEILGIDGRVAMRISSLQSGVNSIDVSGLENGRYLLRSTMADGTIRQKLFIVAAE